MDEVKDGLCAIKFSAPWCSPCLRMAPIVDKLEKEFTNVKFEFVDIDDSPELAKNHNIKSIPTLLILKDGVETQRIVGLSTIDPLRKIFRDLSESA